MKNIVLIGMPGSGKSTVGVVLAKMLGLHFLDSDLVIQETEGKLLSEIIEEKGPDGFLAVEDRVNADLQCEKTGHCHRRQRGIWRQCHGASERDRYGGLSEIILRGADDAGWAT